jgi:hypothetical protein
MANKIIAGMRDAVEVAKGEKPAARITIKGHAYVPESVAEQRYREAIEAAARVAEEVQRHFMQVEAEISPASSARPVLSMQGMAAGKIARSIRALLPKDAVSEGERK